MEIAYILINLQIILVALNNGFSDVEPSFKSSWAIPSLAIV